MLKNTKYNYKKIQFIGNHHKGTNLKWQEDKKNYGNGQTQQWSIERNDIQNKL